MIQRYSRLQSVEEKRNFRNAALLIGLTIISIILLIFFGIPAIGKVASFVSDLKGGNSPISSNDKTPPAPPRFQSFIDYTNQKYVTIGGTAEPGTTVKLTFDGNTTETVVDNEGKFTFTDLELKEGENTYSAEAVDSAGNVSIKSQDKVITYDIKPPEVTIDSPADGATFFGSTQRQINIQGTTETSSSVTINDRIVTVDNNGKFSYPVTLNGGDNQFNIKVTDQSGNLTEKQMTLKFSE
jgi:hypothetical protein